MEQGLPASFIPHLLGILMKGNMVNVEDACNMACVCRTWRYAVMASPVGKAWWQSKGPAPRYRCLANYNHRDKRHRNALFDMFRHPSDIGIDIIRAFMGVSEFISIRQVPKSLAGHPEAETDPDAFLLWLEERHFYFCSDDSIILTRIPARHPHKASAWTLLYVSDFIRPYKDLVLKGLK